MELTAATSSTRYGNNDDILLIITIKCSSAKSLLIPGPCHDFYPWDLEITDPNGKKISTKELRRNTDVLLKRMYNYENIEGTGTITIRLRNLLPYPLIPGKYGVQGALLLLNFPNNPSFSTEFTVM